MVNVENDIMVLLRERPTQLESVLRHIFNLKVRDQNKDHSPEVRGMVFVRQNVKFRKCCY